jgi:hypothetical protein
MGEHAVMRFLTFKELKSGEMVGELKADYGPYTRTRTHTGDAEKVEQTLSGSPKRPVAQSSI